MPWMDQQREERIKREAEAAKAARLLQGSSSSTGIDEDLISRSKVIENISSTRNIKKKVEELSIKSVGPNSSS